MFLLRPLAGLLICCTIAAGQFSPGSPPTCSDAAVQQGNGLLPHEKYCEQFIHCTTTGTGLTKTCAYGTVYDDSKNTCERPELAKCVNWPCDSSTVGRNYPALCCDQYYKCNGSGFILNNCPAGYIFDSVNGQCKLGACADQSGCIRFGTTAASTPGWACYDFPNRYGNPCMYDTVTSTIDSPNRPCPAGTAFSNVTCQCSVFYSNCPKVVNYLENKIPDSQCRSTMTLEFNSYPLIASNEKLGLNQTNYYFQSSGITISGGNAFFSVDPSNGLEPYIYSYFLNGNQLGTPFAMSLVFKWSNPSNGQTLSLLSNNYITRSCTSTFDVSVTYTRSASTDYYRFTLYAKGRNSSTGSFTDASTSATITVGTNNYVEVLVLFNGTLSGQLIERGYNGLSPSVTNKVDVPATISIGDTVATNKCGLLIGKGFIGAVERFLLREGCTDFSKVRA